MSAGPAAGLPPLRAYSGKAHGCETGACRKRDNLRPTRPAPRHHAAPATAYSRAVIRPFQDADVAGVVHLLDAVRPFFLISEDGFRHRLSSTPARAGELRLVADTDNDVVAWGVCARELDSGRDDLWWLNVIVHEGSRGRGIGRELFARLERHALEAGAAKLLTSSRPDDASRHFLERRGFRHTFTRRLSRVDPRSVDLEELPGLRQRTEADGLELLPLTAFAGRPEAIFDLDAETAPDVPADVPQTELRYDEWLERYWLNPANSHEGSFVVADASGRALSLGLVRANVETGKALNDYTATRRAYRNRGLARLVKLASIAWAAERGIVSVFTENDETNLPMLAVNRRLGYRPVTSELSWVREPARAS